MKTKAGRKATTDTERALEKVDRVILLLENLFILQALSAGVGRESIRDVLGVGPNRISDINQGFKRERKNSK
jgi:hypothetical protein